MNKSDLYISYKSILKVVIATFVTILGFKFIHDISHPLTLIFVAIFLALALNPLVNWISKKINKNSRFRATSIAYLIVILILGGFFYSVVPPLVSETIDFTKNIPQTIKQFKEQDSFASKTAKKFKLDAKLDEFSQNWASNIGKINKPALKVAGQVGSTVVSFITVLVLTFLFLVEGPDIYKLFWSFRNGQNKLKEQKLATRMYRVITGFVNGQVILASMASLFAFCMLTIGQHIFHASVNPVALAGIVFLFGMIPMIGNPLASSIVVLACLFSSMNLAVLMIVYFIIYFQIENITLLPYIQSKQNEMTPMTVFIAALLGIGFGGLLGGLVAIPIAGSIRIIVSDHFENKKQIS